MEYGGGSEIIERLERIREEIREYYGGINELKARIRSKAPIKPAFLDKYELINKLRLPFVSGGYNDQPALWLLEYQTIDQEVQLMETLNELAQSNGNQQ